MLDIHQKLKEFTSDITVLYVEDEALTREQYEGIFKLLFKDVKSAKNGEEALEEYSKKSYDLLITDLTMPKMDGVSLISKILDINPSQHVIIMTAHNTSENLRNSIEFQVDGILLKPVVMDKLLQLLYKICHLIYFEKKDDTVILENEKLQTFIENDNQALFLVVIDKFDEIIKQFGIQTQKHIFEAVKEHLSYFGIEENSTLQLHNDVVLCRTNKKYLNSILELLQDFSDSHNTLIVEFNDLKIYITLSYGIVMLENNIVNEQRCDNLTYRVNDIIEEIKNDEHSTYVVKMDVDLEEAKQIDSLSWLGVTLDALKQDTIVPFFQQVVDINTMEIISYEVYSRIKQGDKYILPKFFIDLSERAGISEEISRSVFKQSFEKLSDSEYSFYLSLSDSELKNIANVDYLVYLCTQYNIEHSRVILNIVDHESLNPSGRIVKALLKLKDLGFKIALKGFATGSINFELISIIQPDYIKISQILLEKSLVDSNMKSILSFLLEYIKSAKIKSILVGIENKKILEEGRKLGFNYAQGYFIERPSII